MTNIESVSAGAQTTGEGWLDPSIRVSDASLWLLSEYLGVWSCCSVFESQTISKQRQSCDRNLNLTSLKWVPLINMQLLILFNSFDTFFFSTFCYEATFTCNTHHKGESDCLWHHFKSFKVLFMNIRALVLRFCLVYVRFIQDYLWNRVSEPSVCSIIYSFIILIALQGSSTF